MACWYEDFYEQFEGLIVYPTWKYEDRFRRGFKIVLVGLTVLLSGCLLGSI